jgi:hypothetical protein
VVAARHVIQQLQHPEASTSLSTSTSSSSDQAQFCCGGLHETQINHCKNLYTITQQTELTTISPHWVVDRTALGCKQKGKPPCWFAARIHVDSQPTATLVLDHLHALCCATVQDEQGSLAWQIASEPTLAAAYSPTAYPTAAHWQGTNTPASTAGSSDKTGIRHTLTERENAEQSSTTHANMHAALHT